MGAVVVPAGQQCSLTNSTVNGSVLVQANSALFLADSTINGNVTATDATLQLVRTSVRDNIIHLRPTPFAQPPFGFLLPTNMCGSTVGGSVSITDARSFGSMTVGGRSCSTSGGNTIGGTLIVRNNSLSAGRIDISDNHANYIICTGNTPAPNGSGNVALFKSGQCAGL